MASNGKFQGREVVIVEAARTPIGSGVEEMGHISFADSMSVQQEHGFAFSPKLMEQYNLVPQGISAEMIADKWEIPRSELDEIGLRSHQNAAKATEEGRF